MYLSKVKQIFGDRVSEEYLGFLDKLELAEKEKLTTSHNFQYIAELKAKLYDMLFSDGYIIIGKIKKEML